MEYIEQSRVRHGVFGEGVVIDQRHHGHEYLIRFPNTLQLWIKKNKLTFIETCADDANALKNQSHDVCRQVSCTEPKPAVPKGERSVIEAFRLGIVPVQGIKQWTVGRIHELETVRQWLQDQSSGTMIIRGEYGSGKSHLIEYLHASGFDLNYAVSLVAIDPCDAQPGFPKRVYRHLIRNLRFPYQKQYLNFCEALTLIGKSSDQNPLPDQPFLGKLMRKIMEDKDTPEMWEWIEGQEIICPELGTLYDHTTAANIYCNILSSIGMLAVKRLNLKGVLLLFDEAETSRTYKYAYEWTRAVNLFNALSMVANDEPELEEESIVHGNAYYYGGKTGLIYSGYLRIPYIHQLPSFLKVVYAFTPDFKLNLYNDHNIYEIELEPIQADHMEYLFYKFIDLYKGIYNLELPERFSKHLFYRVRNRSYPSTRKFIKAMVECLDFFRFYPSKNPESLFSNVPQRRAGQP